LELGAGSGVLAANLLDTFAKLGRAVRYRILEPSADFRQRQQRILEPFAGRVEWLDRLPDASFNGVVVANEVLDALPVTRFEIEAGAPSALGVVARGDGLAWGPARPLPALSAAVRAIERVLARPLPNGFRSEVCLSLPPWLQALGAALERGSLLFVDYGLARKDYFHEQRGDGTLICHYRHRAHGDPFLYPGLQDITAWVDFSACAEAAAAAGFDLAGFTTQGQYLLSVLAALPPALAVELTSPREQSALKTLILPGEMGERFKVMLLRKHTSGPELPGKDFRYRL
jgi:SAM-dependent MidA family methyltransferase